MPQYLLDLKQGPSGIDQERCVLMPEVMNSQLRQSRLFAQPIPHLMHRCIWLPSFAIDEQEGELPLGILYRPLLSKMNYMSLCA